MRSTVLIALAALCPLLGTPAAAQRTSVAELRARAVTSFTTAGHPKAAGASIRLDLPASWSRREGARPRVVQVFAAGEAGANCVLLADRQSSPLSPAQWRGRLARLDWAAELGAQTLGTRATTIDGLPAVEVIFTGRFERAGASASYGGQAYAFGHRDAMLLLQCLAIQPAEAWRPVFRAIANSVVVLDRWEQR